MMKKKSSPWARAKYLYVLPLAAVAVAAFAHPEISKLTDEISSVKVNDFSAITENHESENKSSISEETVKVEGTVVDDATGYPITGASVIIRNTTKGTITDLDGKFTLEAPEDAVIVLSYIGMQTYSIIASKENIEFIKKNPVRLKGDTQQMDEVVVVGYEQEEKTENKQPQTSTKPEKDEEIFMVVEKMPKFPGGMIELMKYISKNIKYPVKAQEAKIQGRVIVQFIVNKDGSTSDFTILRSVSPELDGEAIRVLSRMPKWEPGMQRGKAVTVKYTLPVTFRLEKQDKPKAETSASSPTMPGNVSFNKPLENVLIVIDEKVASQQEFSALKPQNIERIEVIKEDSKAQEIFRKYGVFDKKEGVIMIKTKVWNDEPTITLSTDKMDSKTAKIIKDKLINDYTK